MFAHCFQHGGMGVEIFSSAGKDPGRLWKVSQNIHRVYDRSVKGFVFLLEKGATTCMTIPPNEGKDLLGLIQPLLVFQVRLQPGKHFGFDVVVQDDKGNKHRMYFSSTFRDFENHALHVQVPLSIDELDGWTNVIVDLGMLMHLCFRGSHLHSILSISLKPVCRVRRIFTLPHADGNVSIPAMFDFPAGTESCNTIIPDESRAILRPAPAPQRRIEAEYPTETRDADMKTSAVHTGAPADMTVSGVHVAHKRVLAPGHVSARTGAPSSLGSRAHEARSESHLPLPPSLDSERDTLTLHQQQQRQPYPSDATGPSIPPPLAPASSDRGVDVASALRLLKGGGPSGVPRRVTHRRRAPDADVDEEQSDPDGIVEAEGRGVPSGSMPSGVNYADGESKDVRQLIDEFEAMSSLHPNFKSAVADILKGFDPNENIDLHASIEPTPLPPKSPETPDRRRPMSSGIRNNAEIPSNNILDASRAPKPTPLVVDSIANNDEVSTEVSNGSPSIDIDLDYLKRVLSKLENNYLMDYGHEAFARIK